MTASRDKTLPLWDDLPASFSIKTRTHAIPYSRSALFRSLLRANITITEAAAVLGRFEAAAAEAGQPAVSPRFIGETVAKILRDDVSEQAALNFTVWRDFEKTGKTLVAVLARTPGDMPAGLGIGAAWRLGIDSVIDLDCAGVVAGNMEETDSPLVIGGERDKEAALSGYLSTGEKMLSQAGYAIGKAAERNVWTLITGRTLLPWLLDTKYTGRNLLCIPLLVSLPITSVPESGVRTGETADYIREYAAAQSAGRSIPVIQGQHADSALSQIIGYCTGYIRRRTGPEGVVEDALGELRTLLRELHSS